MNFTSYLKDKAGIILLNMAGLFLLCVFLLLTGNTITNIQIIAFTWIIILFIFFLTDYFHRKKIFKHLFMQLEQLEKPYLIAEVMDSSPYLTDKLYREALRISNRSVIETVHKLENEQREYQEYIERWVHEVKLPLTAAKLMCENNPNEKNRNLILQLDRIESQVEQVLYYGRMENAYQDYLIHQVDLRQTVLAAISKNKNYMIQKGIQIDFTIPEDSSCTVSTDEKWVGFILDQIFSNAIKYCHTEQPVIKIFAKRGDQSVTLYIEDNGIGIATEDMGRIFDKGFTGKNGRNNNASTGMGMYLSRQLCDKLGIKISCESEAGAFTRFALTFPDSDHQKIKSE